MALFGTKKQEKKEKSATKQSKHHARAAKLAPGRAHEIIRAPWFSEKALIQTGKSVYAFRIPSDATKADVAAAVKEIYKVSPRMVHITNLPGKRKALRTKRGFGARVARRKAVVYLNAGETIQFS